MAVRFGTDDDDVAHGGLLVRLAPRPVRPIMAPHAALRQPPGAQECPANSSRPISIRRISLVPAPMAYSLASRRMRPVGNSLM